ncbi:MULTISPECIES: cell wall metabolism sensor histidine kinase WalK [Bacteroides]|uniref:sensor histidine kinase n=1 Tax=Bacteroides TaxID=816 RepID=UPI001F2DD6AF|nr:MULTISPECIES: ATP-binding protein [Bacteroides]MCF2736295.1 two-component sensor histidine kinase [Bacteroides caecigallinarum]MCR8893488.1 ATP-binding protein [Bacteroides sp. ET336]MDN0057985.1 ATP-binding protein [Bacteroides caecigallinarum]
MTKFNIRLLTFSRKLFLSVITLFVAFAACFMLFQYQREKSYKTELLNTQLQNYNEQLYSYMADAGSLDSLKNYIMTHMIPNLRVTIITPEGKVIFDSTDKNLEEFQNHSSRKEVQDALMYGSGYAINRFSESIDGEEFFYSAKYFPKHRIILRSALPYNLSLTEHLEADMGYVWFTILICIVLMVIFYRFTYKLGKSITNLQQFALKADKNEPIDMDILRTFPKNELGEISQHIITIYKRLHRAKEALYIEREKLISHLQSSHEGLGVFTKERKEILVNSLFTQYINNISDRNLSSTNEIFTIPELKPIIEFLNKNEGNYSKEEKRTALHLNKNARTFTIECIIFQDLSFEISINDITQEEEQARLKRQLTQNIAHELKTPVSSIQGYLETILSNPNIPKETVKTFLERSYAQSNRLTTLLRDISVLTRMDEAPEMMEREAVNLSLVVENIINEVNLGLEEKHIKVINLMPQALMINGNHSLLYSIFRNLMDNAIAYAGTNIQITINCFRQDDTFYYFSFSDSGVGVEEEHLTRLFERFYRVDKGRSRKLGGTGLGLAIVKNAVLFHGGTIFAKNAPNGGLEFVFTLQK